MILVVARAGGDRVRGRDPVHQGHAHARRASRAWSCGTARPESGCARSRPNARTSRPATRRSPTSAPRTCCSSTPARSAASATRSCPAQRHRASAVAARRRAGAARAADTRPTSRASAACWARWPTGTAPTAPASARSCVGEDGVRAETIWSCMQCNACVEICPVGIEQAPIINQLRRRLVEEGELDANLQATLEMIHKSGNSFGENRRRRGRWTKELDFEVKDARKQPVDVLWFVGDYASFDPRSQQVTRGRWPGCCTRPGSTSGSSTTAERNAGNDVRRVGEEGLFETLAEQNIATLADCEFDTDRHHRPALAQHTAQRVPGARWELAGHAPHHAAARADRGRPARRRPTGSPHGSPTTTPATWAASTASTTPRVGSSSCSAAAGRDAAQPRQLVLLRRGRRAHLDRRQARSGAAVGEPHPRGGGPRRRRAVRRLLPQGRDDVRGRDQDLGQRRADRAARADRAGGGGGWCARPLRAAPTG